MIAPELHGLGVIVWGDLSFFKRDSQQATTGNRPVYEQQADWTGFVREQ
ncbi:hypothetical protein [Spirosoma endbachense]|uniref:Uncharacterized protein n=1 Tax=Spirosoma endbachense TaxID=2666025 RepID=A0A6P1VUK9_9BACT|nr:hypothetical protein [Spirosoma endbachense]QHV95066.1 hypothetical protein GJR95_08545 [Spirosoma endbachense]